MSSAGLWEADYVRGFRFSRLYMTKTIKIHYYNWDCITLFVLIVATCQILYSRPQLYIVVNGIFFSSLTAVTQLGCWTNNLTMSIIPSVEQHTQSLADPYKLRTAALRKCADVASVLGYTAFALMDGGKCLTGPTANQIYSNNGRSSDCGYYGKGGLTGMSVYSFQTGNGFQLSHIPHSHGGFT